MPPKKGKKGKQKVPVDPVAQRWQIKKEEVKRELKLQNLMRNNLARKWHHLVLEMKLPGMREEIATRSIVFGRVLSKKQCVIDGIFKQKMYGDNQSRLNLAAAAEMADLTLQRFNELLEKIDQTYTYERSEILKHGVERKTEDVKMWDNEETRMSTIKWADDDNFTKKFDEMYGESIVKEYEMKNLMQGEIENTEDAYENVYGKIMEQYQNEIKDYNSRTAENKERSIALKKKDDEMYKILASQDKKLGESQKVIDDLRREAMTYEDGTAMAQTRERFNKFKENYYEARYQEEIDMLLDSEQFIHLVETSGDIIWWLETMKRKCKRIISAMNICESYHTSTERFSSLESNYRCICGDNKSHICEDIEITDNLKYLLSIMAEVEVSAKALKEEKDKLKEENHTLCQDVKKWFNDKKVQR